MICCKAIANGGGGGGLEDQLNAAQTEAAVKKVLKTAEKESAEKTTYNDFKTEDSTFCLDFKSCKER